MKQKLLALIIQLYRQVQLLKRWNLFREDYPDVYKAMQTISAQQAEEKSKQLEEEIASLKEKEVHLVQEQAKKELTDAHPDFF